MRKFEAIYKKLVAWLTGGALFVCFVVVLASSVSRYAFNSPFQWSEELAKFAMIYGTVFGAALSYLSGRQIRFSVLIHLVPRWAATRLDFISDLAILVLGVGLTVSGYLFMMRRGGIMASGLGIQMYYPQAAIMIGGVCLFFAAAIRVFTFLASKTPASREGEE